MHQSDRCVHQSRPACIGLKSTSRASKDRFVIDKSHGAVAILQNLPEINSSKLAL
jgi:hypothetical protein